MSTKVLTSLKGRVIRLTRLDSCGAHIVGPCSSIVTAGFISVALAKEEETGEEFIQKDAWGSFCVNEKDADLTKWVVPTINMCQVHPDVLDLVAGANPLTDGTDVIGASFGAQNNLAAFAIEVWTKQAGGGCEGGNPEWGYFVVPYNVNGKLSEISPIENGPLNVTLAGEGLDAPASWGQTPYGDNPLLDAGGFPEGDQWAYVRTTVQPPAVTDGCVAIA